MAVSDTGDPDVDALQHELEQIKDAMGLRERYPTQFRLWLVYGLLVLLASFGSQAVVTYDLPGWGHAASWFGFMGVGVLYSRYAVQDYEQPERADGKPDSRVQWLAIVGYLFAVLLIVSPLLEGTPALRESATIFALVIGAIGTSYAVAGTMMKAYYVRARDRYVFYVGGGWILVYAVAMVHVSLLLEWGYAIFGVCYAGYGIAAYMYLASEADDE